jgi:hypothetical protein
MKKFTLLPLGECFEFQGERYSKTGPLTASNLKSKRQRMIPRSAMVTPVPDGNAPQREEETSAAPATIDRDSVRSAFESYHSGCTEWLQLAEKELSEETASQIRQALGIAHDRFLADLGIN